MEKEKPDVVIRKVSVLQGRLQETAIEMGLKENDLVMIKTSYTHDALPVYELTKVEGSPIDFLNKRMEKEKSVLTEDEIKELLDETVFCYMEENDIADSEREKVIVYLTEREVLANYKKGLREKVQERYEEILKLKVEGALQNDITLFRDGQISVFEWILREVR